jgi:hypothetical protein
MSPRLVWSTLIVTVTCSNLAMLAARRVSGVTSYELETPS